MKDEQPQSWWQTIPGCLTGLAGVITATAALVVTLQQTGVLKPGVVPGKDGSNQIIPPPPNSTSTVLQPGEVKAVINDPDGYTNVRSGQGNTYDIITRISKGEVFYTTPQRKNSYWWPIRTSGGKYGYIHRSKILPLEATPSK